MKNLLYIVIAISLANVFFIYQHYFSFDYAGKYEKFEKMANAVAASNCAAWNNKYNSQMNTGWHNFNAQFGDKDSSNYVIVCKDKINELFGMDANSNAIIIVPCLFKHDAPAKDSVRLLFGLGNYTSSKVMNVSRSVQYMSPGWCPDMCANSIK